MSWSSIPYAIEAILGERKKRDEIRDRAIKNHVPNIIGDRTMTEIEQKALALVNKVAAERGSYQQYADISRVGDARLEVICSLIEKHEADKAAHAATVEGILKAHEAYKQDVSDAVEHCRACSDPEAWTRIKFELDRFIIPKPDPLVEALNALPNVCCEDEFDADDAAKLREALAKRGFKIVEDV